MPNRKRTVRKLLASLRVGPISTIAERIEEAKGLLSPNSKLSGASYPHGRRVQRPLDAWRHRSRLLAVV
jgi:hypothetical protein